MLFSDEPLVQPRLPLPHRRKCKGITDAGLVALNSPQLTHLNLVYDVDSQSSNLWIQIVPTYTLPSGSHGALWLRPFMSPHHRDSKSITDAGLAALKCPLLVKLNLRFLFVT